MTLPPTDRLAEMSPSLVEKHLRHPARYSPGGSLRFRVTSTSASEAAWDPQRYWRGPVWPILNWLICLGLRRAGYREEARLVREDTLRLVRRSGFFEHFDPRTGQGLGAGDFSWTAALWLELRA